MDHEQEVRKLYGDDLQLYSSIIDTDEHEAVIKVVRGGWYDHGIACVLQGSQSMTLADAVLSSRLSEPNFLHERFCATECDQVNSVAHNSA